MTLVLDVAWCRGPLISRLRLPEKCIVEYCRWDLEAFNLNINGTEGHVAKRLPWLLVDQNLPRPWTQSVHSKLAIQTATAAQLPRPMEVDALGAIVAAEPQSGTSALIRSKQKCKKDISNW